MADRPYHVADSLAIQASVASLPEIFCLWAGEFFVARLRDIKHLRR
jgi:hypothetical protein